VGLQFDMSVLQAYTYYIALGAKGKHAIWQYGQAQDALELRYLLGLLTVTLPLNVSLDLDL